jgi:superfamily II DNA or RNA helicase
MFPINDPTLIPEAKRRCEFPNPERVAIERRLRRAPEGSRMAQGLRWKLARCPEILHLWEEHDGVTWVPRGLRTLSVLAVPRAAVTAVWTLAAFPELRGYQREAIDRLWAMTEAILSAPTGAGKTAMAKHLIADSGLPAIVVVPTLALVSQWITELTRHWPARHVGQIGGGKQDPKFLTVASAATMAKMISAGWLPKPGGDLILDECHHALAPTWRGILRALENDTAHVWGLTATPWRNGVQRGTLEALIGPIVEVARDDVVEAGGIVPFDVQRIETGFQGTIDPRDHYADAMTELTKDDARNDRVISLAINAMGHGIVLVLSDRVEHVRELSDLVHCGTLIGGMGQAQRAEAVDDAEYYGVLLATTGVLSEGFDLPEASTLILATPGRFDGALLQRVGRVLRPSPGKARAVVLDLVDLDPVFRSQWSARQRAYRTVGAQIFKAVRG